MKFNCASSRPGVVWQKEYFSRQNHQYTQEASPSRNFFFVQGLNRALERVGSFCALLLAILSNLASFFPTSLSPLHSSLINVFIRPEADSALTSRAAFCVDDCADCRVIWKYQYFFSFWVLVFILQKLIVFLIYMFFFRLKLVIFEIYFRMSGNKLNWKVQLRWNMLSLDKCCFKNDEFLIRFLPG